MNWGRDELVIHEFGDAHTEFYEVWGRSCAEPRLALL